MAEESTHCSLPDSAGSGTPKGRRNPGDEGMMCRTVRDDQIQYYAIAMYNICLSFSLTHVGYLIKRPIICRYFAVCSPYHDVTVVIY